MSPADFRSAFWADLVRSQGTADVVIFGRVLVFGILATLICIAEIVTENTIAIDVTPYEILGAALSLILVLRTNAGYDRWWEARKLWGGITNQCRDLALTALRYGPADEGWRDGLVRWTAAFGHAARCSLRSQRDCPELVSLLGAERAASLVAARHMPTYVSSMIAQTLAEAIAQGRMSGFAFQQADRQRAQLLDHLGGCERIQKTPLPLAYAVKIRRFIFLFLISLPFALIARVGWLTPLLTMLIAYPILALDEIGSELQQPFLTTSLNHLPLDEICMTVERDVLAQLESNPDA
ncbi:MAG TPA: bestrophin family ion channel [Pirellulales bacterium]|nr:bestrophin family ion channel [Pirellulales bacterium]